MIVKERGITYDCSISPSSFTLTYGIYFQLHSKFGIKGIELMRKCSCFGTHYIYKIITEPAIAFSFSFLIKESTTRLSYLQNIAVTIFDANYCYKLGPLDVAIILFYLLNKVK